MQLIEYDMLIVMHPSYNCNFSCVYCKQHINSEKNPDPIDIERFVNRLNALNKTALVSICGGEPFLIPNLTEFVAELTKKHYVRMDTNLSLDGACRKFMNSIDPKRVTEVVFSTHMLEREKKKINIMDTINLANDFQKKGFKIVGNYICYPSLLNRMDKDIEFFKSNGITVLPTFFGGEYNKKIYPVDRDGKISYSEEDLKKIKKHNPYAIIPYCNPYNEPCQAGCSAFCLDSNYEVYPCFTMMDYRMGSFFGKWNMFPKVIRCPKKYCTDQYNKIFMCSLDRFNLSGLQLKTITKKGICTKFETFLILNKYGFLWIKNVIKKILRKSI